MLVDPYGREISYIRISVTDRCDFRCVYCMSEDMTFLPKKDLLTLEELDRLASTFVRLGTRRIRITGGEPLVRKGVMQLFRDLGRHLDGGGLEDADRDDQRQPARALCRRSPRGRCQAHQRFARYARSRKIPRDHTLGPLGKGHGRHRRGQQGGSCHQDQRRCDEGRQPGRVRSV